MSLFASAGYRAALLVLVVGTAALLSTGAPSAGAAPLLPPTPEITFVRSIALPPSAPQLAPNTFIGLESVPTASSCQSPSGSLQRVLATTEQEYVVPPAGSTAAVCSQWVFDTKYDASSVVTHSARASDGEATLLVNRGGRFLDTFALTDGTATFVSALPLLLPPVQDMAAQSADAVYVLKGGQVFSLNSTTGVFSLVGDVSANATAVEVGSDGTIYVLDVVAGKVSAYTSGAVLLREFALTNTVPADPTAFDIGPDGRVYVGDGAGGGAAYANDGTLITTFAPVGPTPGFPANAILARDLLAVDADGKHMLVLDSTGLLEFAITEAAPSYQFTGFAAPTKNPPAVNSSKAGTLQPLRWRVLDAHGAPVKDLGTAKLMVQQVDCTTGALLGSTPGIAVHATHLGNGNYGMLWTVPGAYAKSCRVLNLDVGDGVQHQTLYEFDRRSLVSWWLLLLQRLRR